MQSCVLMLIVQVNWGWGQAQNQRGQTVDPLLNTCGYTQCTVIQLRVG